MATFFTFLTWINIHIQQFLGSKNFQISESFDSQGVDCVFKSTQELSRDILGWPNKCKDPTPEGPALETPTGGYNALPPEGARMSCPDKLK